MKTLIPVLLDSSNFSLWDSIEQSEGKERLFLNKDKLFVQCLDELYASNDPDPALAYRITEASIRSYPTFIVNIVDWISSSLSPKHSEYLFRIGNLILSYNDVRLARQVILRADTNVDQSILYFVNGKIEFLRNNIDEAYELLQKSIFADMSNLEVYDLLHEIVPDFGWLGLKEMQCIFSGQAFTAEEVDLPQRMEKLVECCRLWQSGDRNSALAVLQQSGHFKNNDPYYHYVCGMMKLRVGLYSSALDHFKVALEQIPDSESILIECAYAHRIMGEYDYALSICDHILSFNPYSRKALMEKIECLAHDNRKHELDRNIEKLLNNGASNGRNYEFCIKALSKNGYRADVSGLVSKVSSCCTNRCFANLIVSKNDYANGSYHSSLDYINRALKINPESKTCICQKAKVLAAMGHMDKALNAIDKILFKDPYHLDALDVKKSIMMSKKDLHASLELCDRIIAYNPVDAVARRDKAEILEDLGRYKDAFDTYRETLNVKEDVDFFLSIIREMLRKGRAEDVCEFISEYDDVYGKYYSVWEIRGNAEYSLEHYNRALDCYTKATSLNPGDSVLWHSKGMSEEVLGLFEEAEASYDRAIIIDLENVDYWISKSAVQEKRGDIKNAIDSINKVIKYSPENVFALVSKSRLLSKEGMYSEAVYFLDLVLKILPFNLDVLRMKKQICIHNEDYLTAVRVCNQMMSVKGDASTLSDLIKLHFKLGNKEKAARILKNNSNSHMKTYEDSLIIADAYSYIEDYAEAISICSRIVSENPDLREAKMKLAEFYLISGDKVTASSIYDELKDYDPGDMEATVRKIEIESMEGESSESPLECAMVAFDNGNFAEVLAITENLIQDDIDDPELHLIHIESLVKMGRMEKAAVCCERSSMLFSGDARFHKLAGDLYLKESSLNKAMEHYIEASELGMHSVDFIVNFSRTYVKLGMTESAIHILEESLGDSPDSIELKIELSSIYMRVGRNDEASELLDSVLSANVINVRALMLRSALFSLEKNLDGLMALYPKMVAVVKKGIDPEMFCKYLNAVGATQESEKLRMIRVQ